ncbi:MAG: lysine--tRNA ligase [Patescibacteria group bacterium]|nr:lysine--tRNA ligase [Patescibacteria group bacterium]
MFWGDKYVGEIKKIHEKKLAAGEPLIIRDEKTASGKVHVGSLRGVVIHGLISEILNEQGIKNKFLFEINDFDPMDGLPVYLDETKFRPHIGKPLCNVPSPQAGEKVKNYAEYFGEEFAEVINKTGFKPEFYKLSDQYKAGKFNELIKIALENADKIRHIYKKISGSEKGNEWMPLQVICEKCGKIGTTKVISFDGEMAEYICEPSMVEWAQGCGRRGKISPFNGNAKLPWKVEWAAKFVVFGVDIEGAGKDHSGKGGSREIADTICKEIFNANPPFNIPYEFVHISGEKMSSSKGRGAFSKDIAELLPLEMIRLLMISKDPKKVIDFEPESDTIPVLYDLNDKIAEVYFNGIKDDYFRMFVLSRAPEQRKDIQKRFLPRFSQIAFLVQMPHMDIFEMIEKIKGAPLTQLDREEIEYRVKYAKFWLNTYAPEDYKYELQENIPPAAKNFSEKQKEALKLILDYIKSRDKLDGQELHTKFHEIKEQTQIEPKELFSALYLSILGKESGPKAGWFLSVLDKNFLIERLKEIIK